MKLQSPVILVGAGVSGLCCALDLQDRGVPVLVLEKAEAPGGRVRSDRADGFTLDRGFQVWLEAYPECQKRLDREVLQPGAFASGAILFDGKRLQRFPDPLRHPGLVLEALMHPVAGLQDKARLQRLRRALARRTPDEWFSSPERDTRSAWESMGFSTKCIEGFLTPFFRGIFLAEPDEVSARMFEFVFAMFGQGRALLPQNGIQAIPDYLATKLNGEHLRLNAEVQRVHAKGVVLSSGEELTASAVVVAVDDPVSLGCCVSLPPVESRPVTCLYFDAQTLPFEGPWLTLNGSGKGRVNQVAVPSNLTAGYAPEGRHLVSVSLHGLAGESTTDLVRLVTEELLQWFGPKVDGWRFLREYRIRHALPAFAPGQLPGPGVVEDEGVWVCGDCVSHPSLQGAMASGGKAAQEVLKRLNL
jgi:phytoene dehydrogenase-like protein